MVEDELVPYIIMEANPYRNMPSIKHICGSTQKSNINKILLEKLVEFVCCKIDLQNLENIGHIKSFWRHFYDKQYMNNNPWIGIVFINGEWIYKCPGDDELLVALLKEKNKSYISSSDSDDILSNNSDETIVSIEVD